MSLEAAPAVADTGKQKRRPDAPVGGHGAPHLVDVRAEQLADRRDLVHERHAGRQHRIRGVLAQLGARAIHELNGCAGTRERRIQRLHELRRALVLDANHHAVGAHEVVDRRALLEELGIADHAERLTRLVADGRAQARRGADRHGALGYDDRIAGHGLRQITRHREHVRQVGRPVLPRRGSHRDEDDLRALDRRRQLGREPETLLRSVPCDQLAEARLVDRQPAPLQGIDLCGVAVDANDVITVLRETRPDDQSHVAGSDHGKLHLQELRPHSTSEPITLACAVETCQKH